MKERKKIYHEFIKCYESAITMTEQIRLESSLTQHKRGLALDDRNCRRSCGMIDGKPRPGNRAAAGLGPGYLRRIYASDQYQRQCQSLVTFLVPISRIRWCASSWYATYRSEFVEP